MLGLSAQVIELREANIYCDLKLPDEERLKRLFLNANWAYFLDPRHYEPSRFKGFTSMPATQLKGPDQQQTVVDGIVDTILGAIPGMKRADFAAFEWAINELTDNVLTHSESQIGGLVQVSTFQKNRKRVEFVVADAGIGIPASLRQSYLDISSDTEALDKAIREGVTRDKSLGQGNGLFGSWQICNLCEGHFQVDSGYARLVDTVKGGLHVYSEKIPYSGTLIVATVDFSNPELLQEALRFEGKKHSPVDYIEKHFETGDVEDIVFDVRQEASSLGSRRAGMPVRQKLLNLSTMSSGRRICIDFAGIGLVSSSFADEVVGKIFMEVGALDFMQRFELRSMSPMVKQIVERAIHQRMKA
jgi:STAS-like domain of unknown function (DUF4325)/Histidine kinase-, DNA gyrase B-, and HSP90-like ATPase